MLDDLVVESSLAQNDWPAWVNVEILKGDREQMPTV
jgi:hypothetical protein